MNLAVRWTIGNVSKRGFDALRLSILGAYRIFGPTAAYVVCVNSIPLTAAQARVGPVPRAVTWRQADRCDVPAFLDAYLDGGLAEGVAWKFAPLRLAPDRFELALDNDCILWRMPDAIRNWVAGGHPDACVLAEDVVPAFGRFADLCAPFPRNTGIRGLPPGVDLARALRETLAVRAVRLTSELDEQGLQVAALSRSRPPLVVLSNEVTICSPFQPHVPQLGSCGAHFVGLNMKAERPALGRAGLDRLAAHWDERRPLIAAMLERHPTYAAD